MNNELKHSRRQIGLMLSSLLVPASLGACGNENEQASEEAVEADSIARSMAISVLIDCSGTWLTRADRNRNDGLLQSISEGIMAASEEFDSSMAVRWHVIGARNLGSAPACDVRYEPSLIRQGSGHVVRQRRELDDYLSFCRETVLHWPSQGLTEIDYGLQTASEAVARFTPGAARRFIVLSDFKQEPQRPLSLPDGAMSGIDLLLLYRTLPEDQDSPAERDARISFFANGLRQVGARNVIAVADNAVGAAEVTEFLRTGQ